MSCKKHGQGGIFQSTLPAWGATIHGTSSLQSRNFNPRSPRGERRRDWTHHWRPKISIHAPRVGSDVASGERNVASYYISIHAPRVGSDSPAVLTAFSVEDFNPRSPRGERRQRAACKDGVQHFNPRSPRGERRGSKRRGRSSRNFNPRSPRGERRLLSDTKDIVSVFQSTLPAWGATSNDAKTGWHIEFQSTLPAWGATARKANST